MKIGYMDSTINAPTVCSSDELTLIGHQIDKLWFLFDLIKQKSLSSRNRISVYDQRRNKYPPGSIYLEGSTRCCIIIFKI